MKDSIRRGLAIFGAMTLTPLIMLILSKCFPASLDAKQTKFSEHELRRRNSWINSVACFFCILGAISAFPLYIKGLPKNDLWGFGFSFGMMIICPVTWVGMITLPQGRGRWLEFWHFYALKYQINTRFLLYCFSLIAVLGIVSMYKVMQTIL
jgi:hypothetical protein